MARYTGPTTRISRRFGQYIVGSARCSNAATSRPVSTARSPAANSPNTPSASPRSRSSAYIYGLLERQFRRTFEIAKRERGVTGERFLQLLETRLDSVVYLLGFAKSRAAARQFVNHGHVRVNGRKVDIASYNVLQGDEIEMKNTPIPPASSPPAPRGNRARNVPGWLTRNAEAFKGTVTRLPTRDEMEPSINEQLIVEFYSRF
jgi:small subunit ribosomal protein S4